MNNFEPHNNLAKFSSNINDMVNDADIRKLFRKEYLIELYIEPSEEELTDYINDKISGLGSVKKNTSSDSPFSKILGFFFLLWFLGSIASLFILGDTNPSLAFFIFGQLFFIFGIIALISKISVGWIFSLIGLGIIVVPILIKKPELLSFEVNWDFLAVFGFGLVSLIIGLSFYIFYNKKNNSLKERCVTPVNAKVIKIIDFNGKYPVYEYEFNGKIRKVKGGLNTKACVDQNVTLMINPNHPREVYFKPNPSEKLFIIIFSVAFMLSGMFMIVMSMLQ
jgi:hypothetical protein